MKDGRDWGVLGAVLKGTKVMGMVETVEVDGMAALEFAGQTDASERV